jgi:hypothetical protein
MDETPTLPAGEVAANLLLGLDKPTLLGIGHYLGARFLHQHPWISTPELVVHWPHPHRHKERGWYRRDTITVNLPRCRPPTRTPGYAWSFPGYKADMTPVGVYTHELGHHVAAELGLPSLTTWAEPSVSGYEPNGSEAFAEAFRLFLTNPSLLREGRPRRWSTLTESLGLEPSALALTPWDEVLRLRGAHERFITAARNWIKRGAR